MSIRLLFFFITKYPNKEEKKGQIFYISELIIDQFIVHID